jgi:hypothetical protein
MAAFPPRRCDDEERVRRAVLLGFLARANRAWVQMSARGNIAGTTSDHNKKKTCRIPCRSAVRRLLPPRHRPHACLPRPSRAVAGAQAGAAAGAQAGASTRGFAPERLLPRMQHGGSKRRGGGGGGSWTLWGGGANCGVFGGDGLF